MFNSDIRFTQLSGWFHVEFRDFLQPTSNRVVCGDSGVLLLMMRWIRIADRDGWSFDSTTWVRCDDGNCFVDLEQRLFSVALLLTVLCGLIVLQVFLWQGLVMEAQFELTFAPCSGHLFAGIRSK